MLERFLVSVDLETLDSAQQLGLSLKTISYLNRVHTSVTPKTVDTASLFLQRHFNHCTTYLDVTALEKNYDDILSLLDNGAAKVFVAFYQLKDIVELRLLSDLSRLIVSLDHSSCEGDPSAAATEIRDDIRTIVGMADVAVQVHDVHEWKLLDTMHRMSAMRGFPTRYVTLAYNTWDNYLKAIKFGHIPIVPATALTIEPKKYPHLIPAELLITTSIHSDRPDGLYPTVVVNEHGICLGMVYSNEASVEAALRLGRGVYKSRKRDGLWLKGETSGDTQELISIDWDCDGDSLRFTVRQKGDGNLSLQA